jgi:hypothetical protein
MTEDELHDLSCYICHTKNSLSILPSGLAKCKNCKERAASKKHQVSGDVVKSTPSWQLRAKQSQESIIARRG